MSDDNLADTVEFYLPARPAGQVATSTSSHVQVDLGALSHRGKVRPNNEDSFLVTRFERALDTLLTNLPAGYVPERYAETGYGMLVADGMGGAAAGEVASRAAIKSLVDLVLRTPDWIMRYDEPSVAQVMKRLDRRFLKIREALIDRVQADPSLAGMGTTMTLACSLGPGLIIAHAGDSRVYLFREGKLSRLTHDQTMAQTLADVGAIRSEDVDSHPMRHVLTGAITTQGATGRAELLHLQLADGDQLLLCTDGLTEMVAEAAIAEVLTAKGSAADACRTLVDLALEGGGKDNVTVVLGRYRIPEKRA